MAHYPHLHPSGLSRRDHPRHDDSPSRQHAGWVLPGAVDELGWHPRSLLLPMGTLLRSLDPDGCRNPAQDHRFPGYGTFPKGHDFLVHRGPRPLGTGLPRLHQLVRFCVPDPLLLRRHGRVPVRDALFGQLFPRSLQRRLLVRRVLSRGIGIPCHLLRPSQGHDLHLHLGDDSSLGRDWLGVNLHGALALQHHSWQVVQELPEA
mmetsp:Transcript_19508/g.36718  ORF Transcript_19508/g.36718 Transcript_19508/m.36718 type:complete len:204 (+) Transcript_19508:1223-1834(+)